jgi:hypothetical protein
VSVVAFVAVLRAIPLALVTLQLPEVELPAAGRSQGHIGRQLKARPAAVSPARSDVGGMGAFALSRRTAHYGVSG